MASALPGPRPLSDFHLAAPHPHRHTPGTRATFLGSRAQGQGFLHTLPMTRAWQAALRARGRQAARAAQDPCAQRTRCRGRAGEPRLPVPPHARQVRSLQGTLHTAGPAGHQLGPAPGEDVGMAGPRASRGLPRGLGNQRDDNVRPHSLVRPATLRNARRPRDRRVPSPRVSSPRAGQRRRARRVGAAGATASGAPGICFLLSRPRTLAAVCPGTAPARLAASTTGTVGVGGHLALCPNGLQPLPAA